MNQWIPYESDVVTTCEVKLWNLCVKKYMSWDDVNRIEELLFVDGANPFIRDVCGNYLSTVVFLGFWWTTKCELQHLSEINWITKDTPSHDTTSHDKYKEVVFGGWKFNHSHPQKKHKIIIEYSDCEYQKHVFNLLEKKMCDIAFNFNKKSTIHILHWGKFIPKFINVAKEFLLINSYIGKSTKYNSETLCSYGLFPRDVAYIILRHIAKNNVLEILADNKDALGSFTIENIYSIAKNISNIKGIYSHENSVKLIDLKKKRPRKNKLINEIDLLCVNAKKQKDEFSYKCSKLPNVVGTVIATCDEMTLTCDIPNPSIKPFVMVGRKYDKTKPTNVDLDNIDLDVFPFPHSNRVSRNNIKFRFNPDSFQMEALLISRNGLIIKRNGIDVPINDRSWWITLSPNDVIFQNDTHIQYTFVIDIK